jgi:hypothetical protein
MQPEVGRSFFFFFGARFQAMKKAERIVESFKWEKGGHTCRIKQ